MFEELKNTITILCDKAGIPSDNEVRTLPLQELDQAEARIRTLEERVSGLRDMLPNSIKSR